MSLKPRQDRARETRGSILAAAIEIAQTKGCTAITTTALSRHLDVSVGTIYRYFKTREDVVSEAYDNVYRDLIMGWLRSLGNFSDKSSMQTAQILMENYIVAAQGSPAFLPLLEGIREIRSLAAQQKQAGMAPEHLAHFAGLLGIDLTDDNTERFHLMRHLTSDLSHLYLLSELSKRDIMYDDTVAIIGHLIDRMRR